MKERSMNSDSSDRSLRTRRQVLGAIAGVSLSVALAGCSDGGGDGTGASLSTVTDSQQPPTESETPLTPARTMTVSATQRTTTEAETSSSVAQTTTPTQTVNPPTTRTTTTGGTAGACPSPPSADADPKALLPEPPSGWSLVDEHGEAAGMVGAEVGYSGVYAAPDGDEYGVEILRWPSSEKAQNGVLMYRGMVERGNFGLFSDGSLSRLAGRRANQPECCWQRVQHLLRTVSRNE